MAIDFTLQQMLMSPDPWHDDLFGYRLALSGDYIIIGDELGMYVDGSARIFKRTGETWTHQAKLTADPPQSGSMFGYAVAIDGDTAIVGAYGETIGEASLAGAAYVFVRSGETWSQQARLTSDSPAGSAEFGFSVGISGDTVIVGEHNADAACVFVRSGGSWSLEQRLERSGDPGGFGWDVAIDGDVAIVGAPTAAVGEMMTAGEFHVFSRSGSEWTQIVQVYAPDAEAGAHFGESVDVDIDDSGKWRFIIGAPRKNTYAGSVLIMVKNGGSWILEGLLTASDQSSYATFGNDVSIDGNIAIIGAQGAESYSGAAYVFFNDAGTWTEQEKITVDDSDSLGDSVAIDGDTIAIGDYEETIPVPEDHEFYVKSGVVYAYTADIYPEIIYPEITNYLPIGINVSKNSNISFTTKNIGGIGVNQYSINAIINGYYAIFDGVFQDGYTGSITQNLQEGYDVVINPDVDFQSYEIINIGACCRDYNDNFIGLFWDFQIESEPQNLIDKDTFLIVGNDGLILFYNKITGNITIKVSGTSENLFCCDGSINRSEIFIGGSNGTILYSSNYGQSWIVNTIAESMVDNSIINIHYIDSNNVYALSEKCRMFKWNGSIWNEIILPFSSTYSYALDANSSTNCYLSKTTIGEVIFSNIYFYNGSSFSLEDSFSGIINHIICSDFEKNYLCVRNSFTASTIYEGNLNEWNLIFDGDELNRKNAGRGCANKFKEIFIPWHSNVEAPNQERLYILYKSIEGEWEEIGIPDILWDSGENYHTHSYNLQICASALNNLMLIEPGVGFGYYNGTIWDHIIDYPDVNFALLPPDLGSSPYILNQYPESNSFNINPTTNISFDILDTDSNIKKDSIKVYINGSLVFDGDGEIFYNQYNIEGSQIEPVNINDDDGFHININSSILYKNLNTIRVYVEDEMGNKCDNYWGFIAQNKINSLYFCDSYGLKRVEIQDLVGETQSSDYISVNYYKNPYFTKAWTVLSETTIPSIPNNIINFIHGNLINECFYLILSFDNNYGALVSKNEIYNTRYLPTTNVNKAQINDSGTLYLINKNLNQIEVYYGADFRSGDRSPDFIYNSSSTPNIVDGIINELYIVSGYSTKMYGGTRIYVGTTLGATRIEAFDKSVNGYCDGQDHRGISIHYGITGSGLQHEAIGGIISNVVSISSDEEKNIMFIGTNDNIGNGGVSQISLLRNKKIIFMTFENGWLPSNYIKNIVGK